MLEQTLAERADHAGRRAVGARDRDALVLGDLGVKRRGRHAERVALRDLEDERLSARELGGWCAGC